jgi:hypothetical protein
MKRRDVAYVLIVGSDPESAVVEEALAAGVEVRHCPGPVDGNCPASAGKRCPLREKARATVVYLDRHDHEFPTLPCLALDVGPTVAVLGGTRLPLNTSDGYALVGSDMGALGVLEALSAVIEEDGILT